MKGLKRLLSKEKTVAIYYKLQRHPDSISPKQLVHWMQHSRYDARLAEQLAEHVRDNWFQYDPLIINSLAKKEVWPSAVSFIVEHVVEQCAIPLKVESRFKKWAATVQNGIEPFPWGLFFMGIWPIAGKAMNNQVVDALPSYKKWGYFGKDILFNKQIAGEIKEPNN